MTENTQVATIGKTKPQLSDLLSRWILNVVIPFIKGKDKDEEGPIQQKDDDPKDLVDLATISQVSKELQNKKKKLDQLILLANNCQLFVPKPSLSADIESILVLKCKNQTKTVFITDGDLSYIKGFLTGEKIEFISTASELGKALIGKEAGIPFSVDITIKTMGKPDTKNTIQYEIVSILNHKASLEKLFNALPAMVPQTT